jgi:beta-catenin-like protein 1
VIPLSKDEVHKFARHNGTSSSRHARVEDDKPTDNDNVETGPSPPPEDDEEGDYGPAAPPEEEEDEEGGRFFGGGVTAQEAQVLDYLDDTTAPVDLAPEKMDIAWLRRTALSFEKKISRNAEQRAKFEDDPAKFISSEAELDAEIKALSILSEHPELYPEFARIGCVGSLVGLLAHENTDIAIDGIEIIDELTDEDVDAEEEQWDALVDALFDADFLSLLVSNLERLDETQETDRGGVYRALSIVENLCGRTTTAERVAKEEGLLKWLLQRIQAKEKEGVSQNKQYAAEILAILVQESTLNRRRLVNLDAVDIMLQLVAPYRKRNPEKGSDEEEYVQNLFDALTCIVDEEEGKAKFVEAEGVELCLIMLKEGKLSKGASLRLLDHAVGSSAGGQVCLKIVEAGGLKNMFTLFMRKKLDHRMAEHLVSIFASMLRWIPSGSDERVRLLAKFVEKDYEKTEKLVKLRRECVQRIEAVDASRRDEQLRLPHGQSNMSEWNSRRMEAGEYTLRTVDIVLAWLIAEDDGAKKTIKHMFAAYDDKLEMIKKTLLEELVGVDVSNEEGKDTHYMLQTLMDFL